MRVTSTFSETLWIRAKKIPRRLKLGSEGRIILPFSIIRLADRDLTRDVVGGTANGTHHTFNCENDLAEPDLSAEEIDHL